jgi:hypothetical protein
MSPPTAALPAPLRFWRAWLLVALAIQTAAGYAVAFLHDTALFAWHQDRVGLALWGSVDFPSEAARFRAWSFALLGGTMASWGVALLWVVARPFARREPWAWWAVVTSLAAWFPVDTALSAAHGVWVNVAFNAAALLMLAIPLAATRRWFRRAG